MTSHSMVGFRYRPGYFIAHEVAFTISLNTGAVHHCVSRRLTITVGRIARRCHQVACVVIFCRHFCRSPSVARRTSHYHTASSRRAAPLVRATKTSPPSRLLYQRHRQHPPKRFDDVQSVSRNDVSSWNLNTTHRSKIQPLRDEMLINWVTVIVIISTGVRCGRVSGSYWR